MTALHIREKIIPAYDLLESAHVTCELVRSTSFLLLTTSLLDTLPAGALRTIAKIRPLSRKATLGMPHLLWQARPEARAACATAQGPHVPGGPKLALL